MLQAFLSLDSSGDFVSVLRQQPLRHARFQACLQRLTVRA